MQESSYDEEVNELRALSQLTSQAVTGTTDRVQEVHQAIAGRVFRTIGPASTPVKVTHDAIAGLVYSSIRGITALSGGATAETLKHIPAAKGTHITDQEWGRRGVAALNAVVGDRLAESGNDLAFRVTPYTCGTDHEFVSLDPAQPGIAFPTEPTGKLVVFIHGVGETEKSWAYRAENSTEAPGVTYGSRLQADLGFTPVWVRYNTGRKLVENGQDIAVLLEQLVTNWPVEVTQIAIIGHSIGGLVLRAACDSATLENLTWVQSVSHAMYLGTPHLGSPLERAAGAASWLLKVFPESAPFSTIVNVRSAGIQDLRFGYVDAESAAGDNADDVMVIYVGDTPVVPMPPHADHCFITASRRDSVQALAGELMVFRGSAQGKSGGAQRIAFDLNNGAHFEGVDHFAMVNDPSIYEQIRNWLADQPSEKRVPAHAAPQTLPDATKVAIGAAVAVAAIAVKRRKPRSAAVRIAQLGGLAGALALAEKVSPLIATRVLEWTTARTIGDQVSGMSSHFAGFPFLAQVVKSEYGEIHVSADSYRQGATELRDLDLTLRNVRPLTNFRQGKVESLSGSALLPYSELLTMLAPKLPSRLEAVHFTAVSDDGLQVSASRRGSSTLSVQVRITLAAGNRIKMDFLAGDRSLLGKVLEPVSGASVALRGLPYQLRADGLTLTSDGVRMHLSARNVVVP